MDVFFARNGSVEKLCCLKGIRKSFLHLKKGALEVLDAFRCWAS